jgi:hypothetical protein
MKAGFLAVAAAIASGVSAKAITTVVHNHEAFHLERGLYSTGVPETCGCTTIYTTIYGEATRTSNRCPNMM